eukprot:7738592-Pyramimonas_sp.AAC.1
MALFRSSDEVRCRQPLQESEPARLKNKAGERAARAAGPPARRKRAPPAGPGSTLTRPGPPAPPRSTRPLGRRAERR